MKLNINHILREGAKLEVREIDFESEEVKRLIKNCLKQQEECRKRKILDPKQLQKVITI